VANLAAATPLKELVRTAELRRRIEVDSLELKQELVESQTAFDRTIAK
jgi:hypothetical protein